MSPIRGYKFEVKFTTNISLLTELKKIIIFIQIRARVSDFFVIILLNDNSQVRAAYL